MKPSLSVAQAALEHGKPWNNSWLFNSGLYAASVSDEEMQALVRHFLCSDTELDRFEIRVDTATELVNTLEDLRRNSPYAPAVAAKKVYLIRTPNAEFAHILHSRCSFLPDHCVFLIQLVK